MYVILPNKFQILSNASLCRQVSRASASEVGVGLYQSFHKLLLCYDYTCHAPGQGSQHPRQVINSAEAPLCPAPAALAKAQS